MKQKATALDLTEAKPVFLFLACIVEPVRIETSCEAACDVIWTDCAPEVQPDDGWTWIASPDEMPEVAASCKDECAIAPDADEWADCVLDADPFGLADPEACWDAYDCRTHPCTEATTLLYYGGEDFVCDP